MSTEPRLPEIERGTEVFSVDPLTIRTHFEVDYLHSYKQDTPFFLGLAKRKLLGSHCPKCSYKFATPRVHCMYCGCPTQWFELPTEGRVHSWTVCYFAAQEFLKDVPFMLVLVEFKGVDTLFLSRLVGVERRDIKIGMKVKARFRRKATWSVRDVYFVRAET
ncbi:MAG: nucleotide-binding protein [Verrucomicrobia bacterium]|nr:MAG: nucleotide-binding protein [Verrucomicrobiota bacterium]PYK61949.1 MAG: nucleotide-binding protein [Verrucomicrobiota bacterium]